MSEDDTRITELAGFARQLSVEPVRVHKVRVLLDETQDGDPVVRVLLLLSDPPADTWPVPAIRELRSDIARKATELGLPPVSLTLVAEREREEQDAFAD